MRRAPVPPARPTACGWRVHARREWRAVLLAAGSFSGYPITSRLPGPAGRRVPPLALDRAIPLLPWSVYGYVSLYPQLALNLAYLLPRPRALHPLMNAIVLANALASAVFALWRTTVARPALPASPRPGARLLGWLWRIDPAHNAVPSLHACYAILLAWAHVRLQSPLAPAMLAWSALVAASTLTTKQHQALDVAAGAGLAWLAGRLMFRDLGPADLAPCRCAEGCYNRPMPARRCPHG